MPGWKAEEIQCRVHINNRKENLIEQSKAKESGFSYANNSVTTSKYTFYNFIFLNLTQQFTRLANVYFLVIALLQLLTPLSPTGRYSTAAPLALVVAANMVREIWEDSKRHADDMAVNNRPIDVINRQNPSQARWRDVEVGDIVRVLKGQEFPADVIQLASSEAQGASYVDTCNLDGETNLKIKSSLPATSNTPPDKVILCTLHERTKSTRKRAHAPSGLTMCSGQMSEIQGTFDYEGPNKRLYTFVGTATINGAKSPVDSECVILRGSVLRNTAFVLGIVVYAGRQSKIQMNSKVSALKRSNVERMSNMILGGVLVFEIVMCSLGCIGNYVWAAANRETWYMPFVKSQTTSDVLLAWVTYFILLNNYIPISLYVSMELAKLGQKILIDNDIEMYHEQTDTPCLARTSNLNEELGQIQYIFSDKTGTLTRNEMEFRKCWIAGTSYGFGTTEIGLAAAARGALLMVDGEDSSGRRDGDPQQAQFHYDPKLAFDDVRLRMRLESDHKDIKAITDFMRVLSVAHTVVPEAENPDEPTPTTVAYQAESPDESALVLAARALGFFFCGKTATTHCIRVFDGAQQHFEILNINKFNSTRKRMSVVVRTPEKVLELYVKGADNVMLERVRQDIAIEPVSNAVKMYGKEGLRTLIIAKRTISEEEYIHWSAVYHAASTALTDREQRLMDAAEDIEKDLEILGATAIEDKLQVGVPEAIATLAKAQIRIWVLTGDKQETAENIGFACNLLTDEMERVYLVNDTVEELKKLIDDACSKLQYGKSEIPCDKLSLIVDGKALFIIMRAVENPSATESELSLVISFLELAKMCKAVIACRVSPDQKRQIVAMVRQHSTPTPLTLAIGDGANDVPMILEASVGIGISGNEGMQAVRSADYAIAQFAYLKRLLLVHGRNNYKRTSTVIMYSLYKNCFLVSTLFLYSFWTGWTGTAIFDSLMLAGYNVGWAFVGIILYGSIESDVSAKAALLHPQLYMSGARQEDFNLLVLILWEATAFVHTVACLLVPTYSFMGSIVHAAGYDAGQTVFGLCVMQALVFAVNLKLMLLTANLTWLSITAYLGSAMLFIIGGLSHSTWALSSLFASESYVFYNIAMMLYQSAATWLIQLLTVVIVLLPDFVIAYVRRTFFYSNSDIVREIDQGLSPVADSGICMCVAHVTSSAPGSSPVLGPV